MSIYILSSHKKYVDRWGSIVKEAKAIELESVSKLKDDDILMVSESLYEQGLTTDARLMVLGNMPTFEKCMGMLNDGVKAYGNTYMHPSHILAAVESLKEDKMWIYPDFVAKMIGFTSQPNKDALEEKISILTSREKEIAKLILKGLTNKEIASELKISPNTIKIHTTNIYKKLNVTDRLSLYSLLS